MSRNIIPIQYRFLCHVHLLRHVIFSCFTKIDLPQGAHWRFLDELASENPTIQKMSDSQEQAVRELARAMDTGTIEPLDVVTTTLSAGQETHDDAFVARLQQALSALDIRDEAPRLTAEAQSEEASSSAYADLELEEFLEMAFDVPGTDSEMDTLLDGLMDDYIRQPDSDLERTICAINASQQMADPAVISSSTNRAPHNVRDGIEPPTVYATASFAADRPGSSDLPRPNVQFAPRVPRTRPADAATAAIARGTAQERTEFDRQMRRTREQALDTEARDARTAALEHLDRTIRGLPASADDLEVAAANLTEMLSGVPEIPENTTNSTFRERLSDLDIDTEDHEDDEDDSGSSSSSDQWPQALERSSSRYRTRPIPSRHSSTASSELSIPLTAAADVLLSPPSPPSIASSTDDDPAAVADPLQPHPPAPLPRSNILRTHNLSTPETPATSARHSSEEAHLRRPQPHVDAPSLHPSSAIPLLNAMIRVLERMPAQLDQYEIALAYDTLCVAESVKFCYFLRSWGYDTSVRLVPGEGRVVLGLCVGRGEGVGDYEYICGGGGRVAEWRFVVGWSLES